ncbi:hypothetical protein B0J11DRAFT_26448 [Dendryphion nanum]|uniref:Fe2OG dioxygenase domain-containing protein n=1 Tax=Dendryphion nanum TaxID=256645 RepID=A0A9P9J1M2_9PLEO|nr:hypothetical protein B0J11DRAFT_26448 [Dendryphion nanum]
MPGDGPSQPIRRFSLTRMISHLRSKKQTDSQHDTHQDHDDRPPLKCSPLPLVLPEHQHLLPQLGWTICTIPQPGPAASTDELPPPGLHPLQIAYEELFKASAKFFDLPNEEKVNWKTRLGSEEGWSNIPGEKEFITLRTLAYTPEILKTPAKRYWDLMGAHLDTSLGRIGASLGLEEDESEGLRRYVGSCKRMGQFEEEKTATMLRLFRYEGWEPKTVSEPHADLGLLSCVIGNVPGLEVWNGTNFIAVEKDYKTPCATLLVGRQLERLTNYRYPAGGHRVMAYGRPIADNTSGPMYRFSIVFVLRAHEPVEINSDLLTTKITGPWREPLSGITVGNWYTQIRGAHFNINTAHKERDEQRRKLEAKQGANASSKFIQEEGPK